MTNSKKLLLSLGTIASIAAPLATTVACGGLEGFQGKYNTENDGTVKIWSTFSSTGDQMAALEEMVGKYNDVKGADDQPVEIVPLDGGYSAISPGLRTKFEANDKKTLPNVVIGYPDSLGTVARYDMHLDLGKQSGEAADDYGVARSLFNEQFVSNNDEIGGIEEAGGLYTIPLAKSIDMMTSNKPVLKHFFTALKNKGVALEGEVALIAATDFGDDEAHILSEMPLNTSAGNSSLTTLGDEIFNDAEALLDFVIEAAKVVDIPKDQYVLGIDSITNFMYAYGYSLADADFENFYFNKGEDGYIQYNFGDKDSAGYKNFKTIYEKLEEAMNSSGLYIRDLGYSSDFSKNHQMGFSIGSTAGYNYNFVEGGTAHLAPSEADAAVMIPVEAGNDMMEVGTLVDQTADGFDPTTDRIGTITSPFSTFTNGIYGSEFTGNLGSHDLKLDVLAADVATVLKVDQKLLKGYKDGIDPSEDEYEKDDEHVGLIQGTTAIGASSSRFWYSLADESVVMLDTDATKDTLQPEEMLITAPGQKFGSTGAQSTLLQGPSMFAVHSNEVQNMETRKFMEWMFEATESYDGTDINPAEQFAKGASYILPSNSFLSDATNVDAGNDAQKLAFSEIKSIMDNADHYGFDNPVDYTTSDARDHIKTGIVTSWEAWYNGGTAHSLDTLYTNLTRYSDVFK